MIEFLAQNFQIVSAGVLIGVSASLLGVFVILRKFSLVGDALSHVALPGFALALAFNVNPFFGALVFLVIAAFLIVKIEKMANIPIETVVAVLFISSLAAGFLFIPSLELAESLFGDISAINAKDVAIIAGGSLVIFLALFFSFPSFVKISVSSELAKSEKIGVERGNLVFFLLLSLAIAMGIKMIGTLLIGALVIFPAVIAKNLSSGLRTMTLLSVIFGFLMFFSGFFASRFLNLALGPTVVLSGALFFILSIFFAKSR